MKRFEYLFLIIPFFILGSFPVTAQTIVRGPYLQKATTTSMVIRWRTNVATQSKVDFGTSPGSFSQNISSLTAKTNHEIELLNLTPGTTYYYQLSHTNGVFTGQTNQQFNTFPVPGTRQPVRAWALGDCGTANSNQRNVRNAYYNYINNLPANDNYTDMILLLGDNAYDDGTDSEYQYAIFENMYEDMLKNTVTWSCLGNHDGHSTNSASQTGPYYDIFTFPKLGESGGVPSGTEAYYSFDYANIHFIVLESYQTDRSTSGAMYQWALTDVQNSTADWLIAVWHHPPYTRGSHTSDIETQLVDMRENFLPMLESNGVDLVLCGHSHSYERSYFLNGHYSNSFTFSSGSHTIGSSGSGDGKENGDGAYKKQTTGPDAGKGAVYITAGSSGKTSGGFLNHPAMVTSLNELGSCVLEVNIDTLRLKFLRETGAVDDYFTIIKHGLNINSDLTLINKPLTVILDCSEPYDTASTGSLTASTACNKGGIAITYSDLTNQGSCNNNFYIQRTWTATDSCGNSDTHIQTILLQDVIAPDVTCNSIIDTIYTIEGTAQVPDYTDSISAIDNCTTEPGIYQSPEVGMLMDTGAYNIYVIADDSCGRRDTCFVQLTVLDTTTIDDTVGIDSKNLFSKIDVYPNPVFDVLIINQPYLNVTTYVSDLSGKIFYQEKASVRISKVDVSTWPKGIYFVHFNNEHTQRVIKLLVL